MTYGCLSPPPPTVLLCTAFRPAFILGVLPPASVRDEPGLRARWRALYGLALPASIPFYYEVGASPEADETEVVPGCCVWAGAGLVPVPQAQCSTGPDAVVEQVGARGQGGACPGMPGDHAVRRTHGEGCRRAQHGPCA